RHKIMDVDDVISFSTVIYQIGQNRCIDVPAEAVAGRGENTVPIVLTVGGRSVATNLISRGDARFRVFVNSHLRKAAGADTGDTIDVEIRLDLSSREPEIPEILRTALDDSTWAMSTFRQLTINQRREIVQFAKDAKAEDTRARRVIRIMEVLEDMKSKAE
ncbi:MAG: YdeI/OmpD-associated family protein, partial [Rhodothermia bacterium]